MDSTAWYLTMTLQTQPFQFHSQLQNFIGLLFGLSMHSPASAGGPEDVPSRWWFNLTMKTFWLIDTNVKEALSCQAGYA